jgi:hypothetical protein
MHFFSFVIAVMFVVTTKGKVVKAIEARKSAYNFDCTGKPDGNYPHPMKCTHFVSCVGQKYAYEMECPKNTDGNYLYYVRNSGPNPATSKCDSPEVADRDGSCNTRGGPIVLDWRETPEHVIRYSNGKIGTHQILTSIPSKYKFSIQLVKMKSETCDSGKDHPSIGLLQLPGRSDYICTDYDNLGGNFKWVQYTYNYDRAVEIEFAGTWGPNDEAVVVATIYQEVNKCSDCPSDSFCCEGGASCEGSPNPPQSNRSRSAAPDSTRCIPNHLKCNRRPNCGKLCNADERVEDCGEYGGAFSVHVGIISMALGIFTVWCFKL